MAALICIGIAVWYIAGVAMCLRVAWLTKTNNRFRHLNVGDLLICLVMGSFGLAMLMPLFIVECSLNNFFDIKIWPLDKKE